MGEIVTAFRMIGSAVTFRVGRGEWAGIVESVHDSFPFSVDDSLIESGELSAAVVNVPGVGRHVVAVSALRFLS